MSLFLISFRLQERYIWFLATSSTCPCLRRRSRPTRTLIVLRSLPTVTLSSLSFLAASSLVSFFRPSATLSFSESTGTSSISSFKARCRTISSRSVHQAASRKSSRAIRKRRRLMLRKNMRKNLLDNANTGWLASSQD